MRFTGDIKMRAGVLRLVMLAMFKHGLVSRKGMSVFYTEMLKEYWHIFSIQEKERMRRDIRKALEQKKCDLVWKQVLEY